MSNKTLTDYIKESRNREVDNSIEHIISELADEGLKVEFGKIGTRTTYAMIYDENHDVEIVGYTFIKNLKFYKESTGKYKALQQAMARKNFADNAE